MRTLCESTSRMKRLHSLMANDCISRTHAQGTASVAAYGVFAGSELEHLSDDPKGSRHERQHWHRDLFAQAFIRQGVLKLQLRRAFRCVETDMACIATPQYLHCGASRRISSRISGKNTKGGSLDSHIPAHASTTTVAPFRAWRSSQFRVAGGPTRPPQRG